MKHTIYLLVLLLTFACKSKNETSVAIENNIELQQLRDADQADRRNQPIDWSVVSVNDSLRRARVFEMLDSNLVQTGKDYHNAALIFQHGHDTSDSRLAVEFMEKALELDTTINPWLLAAATDRYLMRLDKPQRYGTQYRRDGESGWFLYEVDTINTTDADRIALNVPTLAESRARVALRNKLLLQSILEEGKSVDELINFIRTQDLQKSDYNLSENEINNLGYQLMETNKADALKIFKLNTELYPDAYNTFDSYGECLLELGKKDESIAAYEKSVELNPKNTHGKEVLEQLKGN